MTADVINLRQARKRRARQERDAEAEANRAKFGTPVAIRQAEETKRRKALAQLGPHRRERRDESRET
ncbi:MAG: DUF4169 family protein [Bauldia sp.]